jgi:DNA-binding response OmpR family regulator
MSTTLKVLLVEDDPEVLLGTKKALELAGFEVEPLTDAETAPKRPEVRSCSTTSDRPRC